MTEIVIDKKKYILIPEKNYQLLQKQAALKTKPEKTFTVEQARAYSKKMIRKWQPKSNFKTDCADNIAAIACYIESKGMIATADKFADDVYDYFIKVSDTRKSYPLCREPQRAFLGFKCIPSRLMHGLASLWLSFVYFCRSQNNFFISNISAPVLRPLYYFFFLKKISLPVFRGLLNEN